MARRKVYLSSWLREGLVEEETGDEERLDAQTRRRENALRTGKVRRGSDRFRLEAVARHKPRRTH